MVLLAAHLFVKQMKHAMANRAIVTKQLVCVEMDPLSLIVQVCNETFMQRENTLRDSLQKFIILHKARLVYL